MADTKSRFKRPETPATSPSLNPEAERFIRGTDSTPEESRVEPAPPPEAAHQVEKGTPTKPEPMKRLTIDIPESLHKRVKSQCGAQGTTIADAVRAFLEKKFPEPKS
jgi:ParG